MLPKRWVVQPRASAFREQGQEEEALVPSAPAATRTVMDYEEGHRISIARRMKSGVGCHMK